MTAGTKVSVYGLKGAAQHNGKAGTVETYDHSSERYVIRLEDGDQVKIKFDNLVQRVEVEVMGMQNRPELNGKSACVVDYDAENDRYYADIAGVGRASLQLINLILPADTRGKVVGLTSEKGSRWNDKVGKVVSYDREAGRYLVEMTKDDQLRVRPDNLKM